MKRRTLIAGALALVMAVAAPIAAFAQPKYEYTGNSQGYPWDIRNTEYFVPVKSLMDRNIILGDPSGYFRPEDGLTRAELAVMVAKITNNAKNQYADANLNYFDDLTGYDWAKPFINACSREGLMKGKSARTFDPKGKVSYAEYMTVVARIQNPQLNLPGKWPQNYINYAQTTLQGLVQDRNITDWNAPAKRGDVALILFKGASKTIQYDLTEKEKQQKTELVRKLNGPEPKNTGTNKPADNIAGFSLENLKFAELTFNDTMDKFGDMPIANGVKVFTYGEKKDYKKDMKLPTSIKDLDVDTIYKYKNAKTKAFYIEKNGKIAYMLLPKDTGFTGSVYCVVNGTQTTVSGSGERVEVIGSLTAGNPVAWQCKPNLKLDEAATKYHKGNFVKLSVNDGIVNKISPLLHSDGDFKVLTKVTPGGSVWETVTENRGNVLVLSSGAYIATKDSPTVYKLDGGTYTRVGTGSLGVGKKVKAFDITDDKDTSADLLIVK